MLNLSSTVIKITEESWATYVLCQRVLMLSQHIALAVCFFPTSLRPNLFANNSMLPTLLAYGLPPDLAADPSTGSTYKFTQKVYLHQTNAHTLKFLKRPSILQVAVSLTANGSPGAQVY